MAERFGGRYSPQGSTVKEDSASAAPRPKPHGLRRAEGTGRRNLLWLAPLPLLWTAFRQDALGMAVDLGAAAVLAFAVFLLGEGMKAQAAYDERAVARRPALPRKVLAAVLTGLGVTLAAYAPPDGAIAEPLLYGVIAVALHVVAFGIDPLRNKGFAEGDSFQKERVARAVDAAETTLGAMLTAIKRAEDRSLERRVESFAATARAMFRRVEEDPRDLTAARKYLGVYLEGARDATVKFADLYARNRDPQARKDYAALLDDLETNFAARSDKLLESDRTDLDVEIGVLRDRLSREGVAMSRD